MDRRIIDPWTWQEEYGFHLERLREAGTRYASTLVGVTRLAFPEFLVEIEATAAR